MVTMQVLQRDSLIKELNLPPEMMTFGTFGTLKPAKPPESLPRMSAHLRRGVSIYVVSLP